MVGLPSSPKKDTPCTCVYYLYICLYTTYGARIGRGREPSVSTGGKSTQVAGPEASRASMDCPDVAIVRSGFGIRTCRFVAFFCSSQRKKT